MSDHDGKSSLPRDKSSAKPVYKMTRYDPMLNAFPDSINSTVLTGSIINTSLLPANNMPFMTATIKPNIKKEDTVTSTGLDQGFGAKEPVNQSPKNTEYGGMKGKKIGMAATTRANNLRASHAGGFVFDLNSAKNASQNNSLGIWPKNLGTIEAQKSQQIPPTLRGAEQMTITLPPLLANNSLHNQYREVINRQYQERSP